MFTQKENINQPINGNENYAEQLSKSINSIYESVKNNNINDQINDLQNSSKKFLGDIQNTFNLNPEPINKPQSIINQQVNSIIPQSLGSLNSINSNNEKNSISNSFTSLFNDDKSSKSSTLFEIPEKITSLQSSSLNNSNNSMLETVITVFLLILCLVLIVIYGLQYFYEIDIIAKIKNIFTNHPEIEIEVKKEEDPERNEATENDVLQILKKPQVFNIPENNYIYSDAKAVCKAYGARLATYKELEEAYGKGAEWCNYGWSEDQMALFPTQEKTWNELQKIEGHENDCGRPGINGGFIDNPNLKFGVNCYGYKPKINKVEKELMENDSIYPKTKKDIAMEERVEYWKNKLNEIIVSPFNHNKWSKI